MLKKTHTPQNIYIITRSTNIITMNISNIAQFLGVVYPSVHRVVTDLHPSTATLLTSMQKKKKKYTRYNKFQKYIYTLKNK
jgi:hypothetical protein